MNINGVVEEISDCGNVDTAAFLEPLDMQPEKFSEGKLISVNEESGCDEKDSVPKEVMVKKKKFTLRKLQKCFTTLIVQMMKWWKLIQT